MSTDDIAVVEEFHRALARHEMDRVRELIAPEFVLDYRQSLLSWRDHFDGSEGFFEFFGLRHTRLDTHLTIERNFKAGNLIVVIARSEGRIRGTDRIISSREVELLEVRDRRITRFTLFEEAAAPPRHTRPDSMSRIESTPGLGRR